MPTKLPRVIGLEELLSLAKPLKERPAPLVYFSGSEFKRLTEGATELKRRPSRDVLLPAFDQWGGGGMVQSRCESPPGQICFGQWRPGPGGAGVYFDCVCRPTEGGGPLPSPQKDCKLLIDKNTQRFQCSGDCRFGSCRLGLYRDPSTGTVMLDCRCAR
jgi:hypothetical protein